RHKSANRRSAKSIDVFRGFLLIFKPSQIPVSRVAVSGKAEKNQKKIFCVAIPKSYAVFERN
ncbi:MAG: hypothetical protein QF828_06685, partial [Pseudomonadales bacterium]|nr:hypothetical protein [Pseudomonadales bacterium]